MTIPATALSESSPAGSDNIALGDNVIRTYKTQNREILEVDHKYESSGQDADMGKHKKVSLIEQADLGTGAVGKPILGAQTVSAKAELVFTDEDNNDIQLTSAGKVNLSQVSLASVAGIMALIYPVGSVVTLGVSTNPATLFGVGTWSAIAGKVIVGIDAGQSEFDTLDETGGAKTHTLSSSEMPAHSHGFTAYSPGSARGAVASAFDSQYSDIISTSTAGGSSAHNNLQPYIVKYCWQRVS